MSAVDDILDLIQRKRDAEFEAFWGFVFGCEFRGFRRESDDDEPLGFGMTKGQAKEWYCEMLREAETGV